MIARLSIFCCTLVAALSAAAQGPVSWTFASRPLGNQLFEIHMVAHIRPGWHIYAHQQPKEAIATPTTVRYASNPLVALRGSIREQGKRYRYKDVQAGIEQDQYADQVDFVQVVRLKAAVKTQVAGAITYQACTDAECLKAESTGFTIALQPNDAMPDTK